MTKMLYQSVNSVIIGSSFTATQLLAANRLGRPSRAQCAPASWWHAPTAAVAPPCILLTNKTWS